MLTGWVSPFKKGDGGILSRQFVIPRPGLQGEIEIMKIVGVVGSPRKKGNTDILTDTFLEGARAGGAEAEKFFLSDFEINQCRGCFRNCMLKSGAVCPMFDDDMGFLLGKMTRADVALFASPLYCGTYTAIMAKFFERCLPLLEVEIVGTPGTREGVKLVGNPLAGKKAAIALVQDLVYPQVGELALQVFEKTIGGTYRMDIVEKIHVVDVRDKGDIKKKEEVLKRVFETGKRLALS